MKHKCFEKLIIAEIGSVHDGSFGNALKLIDVAKECGAKVVKFQVHFAEEETLENAISPIHFSEETRYKYFKRTAFTIEEWKKILEYTHKNKLLFMASVFSKKSLDLLLKIRSDYIKVPSGEVTNLPLLHNISKIKLPVVLSTGMSNWDEIDKSIETLKKIKNLAILQCSSIYPCSNKLAGLNIIQQMKNRYNLPTGFSDHTSGSTAAIGAIFNGATIIEKHLTFSKKMYGSDAKFAMEPTEFKKFVNFLKEAWVLKESIVDKNDISNYKETRMVFEKSIVAMKNLKKGHLLRLQDLNFKKPGDGIRAFDYKQIIGKKINKSVKKNHKFSTKDLI